MRYHDVTSKKDIVIGAHEGAIKSVVAYNPKGLVITGSWDKSIKGWTINAPNHAFMTVLSDKVYAIAAVDHFLAVGTADKNVSVFDIRKISEPFMTRPSGFAQHIRSIAWLQNNEGYAVASSEGRVAVEYVTSSKKAFSFKCHRAQAKPVEGEAPTMLVYPVNALAVHPKYTSLATGASDATVCIWDIESKKRVSKFQASCSYVLPRFRRVQALSFSKDGSKLALGCSYNSDGGVHE